MSAPFSHFPLAPSCHRDFSLSRNHIGKSHFGGVGGPLLKIINFKGSAFLILSFCLLPMATHTPCSLHWNPGQESSCSLNRRASRHAASSVLRWCTGWWTTWRGSRHRQWPSTSCRWGSKPRPTELFAQVPLQPGPILEVVNLSSTKICRPRWGSDFNQCETYLELIKDRSCFEMYF
jgi:hypothetical protein